MTKINPEDVDDVYSRHILDEAETIYDLDSFIRSSEHSKRWKQIARRRLDKKVLDELKETQNVLYFESLLRYTRSKRIKKQILDKIRGTLVRMLEDATEVSWCLEIARDSSRYEEYDIEHQAHQKAIKLATTLEECCEIKRKIIRNDSLNDLAPVLYRKTKTIVEQLVEQTETFTGLQEIHKQVEMYPVAEDKIKLQYPIITKMSQVATTGEEFDYIFYTCFSRDPVILHKRHALAESWRPQLQNASTFAECCRIYNEVPGYTKIRYDALVKALKFANSVDECYWVRYHSGKYEHLSQRAKKKLCQFLPAAKRR